MDANHLFVTGEHVVDTYISADKRRKLIHPDSSVSSDTPNAGVLFSRPAECAVPLKPREPLLPPIKRGTATALEL
jgi:hypothetical protein